LAHGKCVAVEGVMSNLTAPVVVIALLTVNEMYICLPSLAIAT
jgi:hypothetical protein